MIFTLGSFRFKREVSKEQLKRVWRKKHPRKRFPKVRVFILSNREFNRVLKIERKQDPKAGIKEYHKRMPSKSVMAFAFVSKSGYIVVKRLKSPFSLKETLAHELKHISKGDVN